MFFTDPAALLAVFSQLEGSNMLQIQTAQDAEAALEAARSAHAAAAAQLDGKAGALRRQVAELEGTVSAARQRCAALRAAAAQDLDGGALPANGSSDASGSKSLAASGPDRNSSSAGVSLAALAERLEAAYEAAGFAPDASVMPLQMLQKVEAALEECLAAIGPPGGLAALAAEAVERAREKERRQAARADKLAAQQAEHVSGVVGGWSGWAGEDQRAGFVLLASAALQPGHPSTHGWPSPHPPIHASTGGTCGAGAAARSGPQVPEERQARYDAQRGAAGGGGCRGTPARRGCRG